MGHNGSIRKNLENEFCFQNPEKVHYVNSKDFFENPERLTQIRLTGFCSSENKLRNYTTFNSWSLLRNQGGLNTKFLYFSFFSHSIGLFVANIVEIRHFPNLKNSNLPFSLNF